MTRRTPAPLVVLGPTTTGKTRLAAALCRQLDGELINADKFHLFGGVAIGTGRADADGAGVPTHLFGCLPLGEQGPSVAAWRVALRRCVADVLARGKTPVIEGSSVGFAAAAARDVQAHPGARVIGLRRPSGNQHRDRGAARVSKALEAGLAAEAEGVLRAGQQQAWAVRKSVVFPAVLDHVSGQGSEDEACDRVARRVLDAAAVQERKFEALGSLVHWMEPAEAWAGAWAH